MSEEATRFIYLPDSHGIFGDEKAISCALAFGRLHKPDIVICGGDHVDFYQLSDFDKNPDRLRDLQVDVDAGAAFLGSVRKSFPRASIIYLMGNHEDRLRRFLWRHGPSLKYLRDLKLERMLGLGKLNIKLIEDGVLRVRTLIFKHGTLVRAKSGVTATGEMEREGMSGVSGHTHRLALVSRTNRSGRYTWAEAGCLCRLDPEYMPGQVPDWQQGLAYGAFIGSRFTLNIAQIIDGKTVYGDKVVSAQ